MNAIELDKNTSFLPYLQLLLDPLQYPLPNFMFSSPFPSPPLPLLLPSSFYSSSSPWLLLVLPIHTSAWDHTADLATPLKKATSSSLSSHHPLKVPQLLQTCLLSAIFCSFIQSNFESKRKPKSLASVFISPNWRCWLMKRLVRLWRQSVFTTSMCSTLPYDSNMIRGFFLSESIFIAYL